MTVVTNYQVLNALQRYVSSAISQLTTKTRSSARPSRTKKFPCSGSASDIPFNYGCVAKFVPELAKMDKVTVPDFIDHYLMTGLGSNMDSAKDLSSGIRSAWGIVSATTEGDILAHICKTAQISLEAQAKPYVITSGNVYVGTAILGTKFHLTIGNKTFSPLENSEFADLIRDVDAHTASLRRILEMCGHTESVRSMRHLRDVVLIAKLSSLEVDQITDLAAKLSFTQPYWSFNYVNIIAAISLLLDSSKKIDVDIPMHPNFLFTKDRTEEVLSAFGINAPSFNFPSATKYMILEKPFSDLKSINMRWVPISDAVADFKRSITEGYITQPKSAPTSSNAAVRTFTEKQKIEDLKRMLQDLTKAKGMFVDSSVKDLPPQKQDESVDFF